MFKIVLLALIASLGLPPRPPDLYGLATWYGPPAFVRGDLMRDGEPLDLAAPTVAVDDSHWPLWAGARALVLTECGGLHRVRITDTGHLYRAGRARLGVRGGVLRYWFVDGAGPVSGPVLASPVLEQATEWLEEGAHRFVADFPRDFFARAIACEVDAYGRGETTKVWVWIDAEP